MKSCIYIVSTIDQFHSLLLIVSNAGKGVRTSMKFVEPGIYDGGVRVTSAWNHLITKLKPMDIFFTQSDDIFGKGIRIVSKHFSPDRECEFNHTGIFTGDGACTLECLSRLEFLNLKPVKPFTIVANTLGNCTPHIAYPFIFSI
jgi:hypothetical protein